ncbi:MAG: hypothetical protein ABI637_08845, partial [Gemmatimonadota bacterium]
QANIEGQTLDLGARHSLSLGQLAHAMRNERRLNAVLASALAHGSWFAGQLPAILDAFRLVRNDGSHQQVVPRDKATYWRDLLMGVGCEGYLVQLARVRLR